ncbi:leucine-rich repeat protein [Butyrivibrio sp. VCD2006]|uniref:leucine-rich repeat protein n=1 Tax=Butyrivibrio sp. VCD2006 TaxID=1280664 RepID=UPI00047DF858|nr:leucine-rich repeat protein [Butyrivibrio sp. VCD2006]
MIRDIKLNVARLCLLFSAVLVLSTGISVKAEREYDLSVTVSDNVKVAARRNAEEEEIIRKIISQVNTGWTDEEKALFVHDYLCETVIYDYDAYDNGYSKYPLAYSSYGAIVLHKAVCSGYAYAYEKIMNRLGIECKYVTSDALSHAWNIIKVNGKWYYVDCTWDDPTTLRVDTGACEHRNFMRSKEALHDGYKGFSAHNSSDWKIGGEHIYSSTKYQTSKDHDSYYWTDVSKPMKYVNGKWCYRKDYNGYYYDYKTGNMSSVTTLGGVDMSEIIWLLSYGDKFIFADANNMILTDKSGRLLARHSFRDDISNGGYIKNVSISNTLINYVVSKSNSKTTKTLDWSSYLIKEEKLPVGVLEGYIGTYTVTAGTDYLLLTDMSGKVEEIYSPGSSIISNRYIHDISVNEGVVTYTTWLKTPEGSGSETQRRKPKTYAYTGWQPTFSGTFGDNLSWRYSKGKLTISGNGSMGTWQYSSLVPWSHLAGAITEVDIKEGVTDMSDYSICNLRRVSVIRIPESVTYISSSAVVNVGQFNVYYGGYPSKWEELTSGLYSNDELVLATVHYAKDEPTIGDGNWTYKDGILTIKNDAAMSGITYIPDLPWYKQTSNIKKIVVEEGVTTLCKYLVTASQNLEHIYVPSTITEIDDYAFGSLVSSATIHYDGTRKKFDSMAGSKCSYYLNRCTFDCTKVNVEFAAGKNQTSISQVISKNGIPSRPADPSSMGYTFTGWIGSDNTVYGFNTGISEDVTFTAKWDEAPVENAEFGNLNWSIKDGTLTISGNEAMPEVSGSRDIPWDDFKNRIDRVVIEDGITYICKYFVGYNTNIQSVSIPASITKIENYAFSNISESTEIYYDGTLKNLKAIAGSGYSWYLKNCRIDCSKVNVDFVNGSQRDAQIIEKNTIPVRPTDPEKNGYRFDGWYTSSDYSQVYSFDTDLTEDITLYAKWTEILTDREFGSVKWTLSNDTLTIGGNGDMDDVTNSLSIPWYNRRNQIKKIVIKEGVTSICAYITSNVTNLEEFYIPDTITSIHTSAFSGIGQNVKIHYDGSKHQLKTLAGNGWYWYLSKADLDVTKVYVEFSTVAGHVIEPQIIDKNSIPTRPADPVLTGYKLEGWYKSTDYSSFYEFNTPIDEDVYLVPSWVRDYSDNNNQGENQGNTQTEEQENASGENQGSTQTEEQENTSGENQGNPQTEEHESTSGENQGNTQTEEQENTSGENQGNSQTEGQGNTPEESQDDAENEHAFGSVSWKIIGNKLLITGNGDMGKVTENNSAPWYAFRQRIQEIVISEGVTSVCTNAFNGMNKLENISLPSTLTTFDDNAFNNLNRFTEVRYNGTERRLNDLYYACCQTKLPAGWYTYAKVSVIFEPGEGFESFEIVTDKETTIEEPEVPVRSGYMFMGWYTAKSKGVLFWFDSPVYVDRTVYGMWGYVGDDYNQTDNRNENENGEPDSGQQEDSNNNESGTSTSDNVDSTDQSEYSTEDSSSGSLPWTVTPKKHYDYSSDTANTTGSEENDAEDEDGIITVRGEQYEVYNSGTAATIINGDKKAKSVNIGDNLSYNGKSYEINEIAGGAYKNCKKLRTVKIGANIEKIGSSAFKGCKNLKSITIKANNLRTIGAASFKGIKNGAKITIICKDKKTFNKLVKQLKKAGAKKAKYKFKKG